MRRNILFAITLTIFSITLFVACAPKGKPSKTTASVADNNHLTMAVLYTQKAAEYKALCYQAFNIAELRLNEELRDSKYIGKRAIVVDIDETVLDNSPFEASCITQGTSYPTNWNEWIIQASAKAVPGAVSFLNYAYNKGVNIFYISNRKDAQVEASMKNLLAVGFPDVTADHMLFSVGVSSKEIRRKKVMETHKITLLIGDNLADFSELFDSKSLDERDKSVEQLKEEFGKRFIVLPNAMYGDWEGAIYDYDYKKTNSEKDAARKKHLLPFK